MLAEAGEAILNPPEPREIVTSHKKLVKKGIGHKQSKPGKNKPAKGYNPITKEWENK